MASSSVALAKESFEKRTEHDPFDDEHEPNRRLSDRAGAWDELSVTTPAEPPQPDERVIETFCGT